jgi:hypothetical protein
MADQEIQVFADDEGIWRRDKGGPKFGIRWEEILSIAGYTMTYFTEPEVEIEFDFGYGKSFRINQTWPGFEQVVKAVSDRRMFREADRFERVSSVGDDDEIYEVWERRES